MVRWKRPLQRENLAETDQPPSKTPISIPGSALALTSSEQKFS